MSNQLAIAAVTATLRQLLMRGVPELPGNNVTTRPPDRARTGTDNADQLNLFLYQTSLNGAWRNADLPRQSGRGDVGQPPLALNLHYLVTAFGQGDDDMLSHRWLGAAMRVFHDHPLLGAEEIRTALAGNDLHAQVERVRITSQPLSLEEMSKLWTTFQTQYRISAAYEVDVVLIESTRPARAQLPVLRRGESDRGPEAVPGVSLPLIEEIAPPNRQSSVLLGDEIVITGRNLGGLVGVRFTSVNARLAVDGKPFTFTLAAPTAQGDDATVRVTLPNDAAAHAAHPAGVYTVAVIVQRGPKEWSSNEVPIAIAPRIEGIAPPNPLTRDASGNVTLTITCSPRIRLTEGDAANMRFAQQVSLLLGTARQLAPSLPPPAPAPPATAPTSTDTVAFTFKVEAGELEGGGDFLVRLRVDGVDLPLVNRAVTPPAFDTSHVVTIT